MIEVYYRARSVIEVYCRARSVIEVYYRARSVIEVYYRARSPQPVTCLQFTFIMEVAGWNPVAGCIDIMNIFVAS